VGRSFRYQAAVRPAAWGHALGRLLAFRKNGVLRWVGTDHLGSTIRVADPNFAALDRMRYAPFGASRDPGTELSTDHKFTGQIEDASTALNGAPLYWYASRAYDPALGRFTCPDSIVPSPGDPQSLNRYSYVRNNPLTRVDPTGHWDLSTYQGRQAARDALGQGYVVGADGIYDRTGGGVYSGTGQLLRHTGRTNTPRVPMADPTAVMAGLSQRAGVQVFASGALPVRQPVMMAMSVSASTGDPYCDTVLLRIERLTRTLQEKHHAMLRDEYDLYRKYYDTPHPDGKGSWIGHQDYYDGLQVELDQEIQLWFEHCQPPGGGPPPLAVSVAQLWHEVPAPPSPAYGGGGDPYRGSGLASDLGRAAQAAAIAAAAAIVAAATRGLIPVPR
jgi:RHS repeat-associated protein